MAASTSAQASSSSSSSTSPAYFNRLRRSFDPDSPLFVATAIGTSTIAAGAVGGIHAFSRSINPFTGVGVLGGRWLIISSSFFGFREYVVSPLLLSTIAAPRSQYARRLEQMSDKQIGKLPSATPLSDIWTERLLDSFLAGGATAAMYTWLLRPGQGLLKASWTGGFIALVAQLAVNGGRRGRIAVLSRSLDPEDDQAAISGTAATETSAQESVNRQIRQSFDRPTQAFERGEHSFSAYIMDMMSYVIPITKMTTVEYLQKLQDERKKVDQKLIAIEQEENRLYEFTQEQMRRGTGESS